MPDLHNESKAKFTSLKIEKIPKITCKTGGKIKRCKMRNYTKRFKEEMAFFIHPKTGYVTYNKKCLGCIHDCKQSYRTILVVCRFYLKAEGGKNQ